MLRFALRDRRWGHGLIRDAYDCLMGVAQTRRQVEAEPR